MKAVHVILFLLLSLFIVDTFAISSENLEKLRARTGGLSHRELWAKKLENMETQMNRNLRSTAAKAEEASERVASDFKELLNKKKREL